MNKVYTILILSLVIGIGTAQILENGNIENGYVIINNQTYKIVNQEKVYIKYDGKLIEQRKIFVEDTSLVNELSNAIGSIKEEISKIQGKISILNQKIVDEVDNEEKLKSNINITGEKIENATSEINNYNQTLNKIQKEKIDLVNKITDNFLLNKTQTYALSTLIIVLVLSSIVLEILGRKKR